MKARIYILFGSILLLSTSAYAKSFSVPNSLRSCQTNSDCVIADRDCGDCCQFEAVAKSQRAIFETEKKSQCSKQTTLCDCSPDYAKLQREGKLTAVSKPELFEEYEKTTTACINNLCTFKDVK